MTDTHAYQPARRWRRLTAAAAVAALGAAGVSVVSASEAAHASAPLRVHASAISKDIAATVHPGLLDNLTYRALVATEFNAVDARHALTWEETQPDHGQWDFTASDAVTQFGQQYDQDVYGGPLVTHHHLPSWVENLPSQALRDAMLNQIATLIGQYHAEIDHWRVVAEPFDDDGSLRQTIWLQKLGPGYIADALLAARSAKPSATLYITDHGNLGLNAKSDALYNLVTELISDGVPVEGVGLGGHYLAGEVPGQATLAQNIDRFTNLGLEVSITDLKVDAPSPPSMTDLLQQAEDYHTVMTACIEVGGCRGATVWEYDNPHSWVPAPPGADLPPPAWPDWFLAEHVYAALHDALADPQQPSCTATYALSSAWSGGFQSEITVTNGPVPIDGWRVEWRYPPDHTVDAAWNADVTDTDGYVVADNMAWNGALASSEETTFGLQGSVDTSHTLPTYITCTPVVD